MVLVAILSGCSGDVTPTIAAATVQLDSAVQTASLAVGQAADDATFATVAETTVENSIAELDDASSTLSETVVAPGREQDGKREVTSVLEDSAAVLDDARTLLQAGDGLEDAREALTRMAERTAELRERWEPFS